VPLLKDQSFMKKLPFYTMVFVVALGALWLIVASSFLGFEWIRTTPFFAISAILLPLSLYLFAIRRSRAGLITSYCALALCVVSPWLSGFHVYQPLLTLYIDFPYVLFVIAAHFHYKQHSLQNTV
jgi:hypothetical protein